MKRLCFVVVVLFALMGSSQAAVIDLTVAGSTSLVTNGVAGGGDMYVVSISPQATGTGLIDPFLKFTTNNPGEQAYNFSLFNYGQVSGNDAYGSSNWTHVLQTSTLATFTWCEITNNAAGCGANTQLYYDFIIDIDQQGADSMISLDQLVISSSNDPTLHPPITNTMDTTSPFTLPDVPTLGTPFYDLNGNTLILNYRLNSGSGSGDYDFFVPVPSSVGAYIYLYNALGYYNWSYTAGKNPKLVTPYGNNDGPDEWWAQVGPGTPIIPEPATMLLLGSGLIGLGAAARRRRK